MTGRDESFGTIPVVLEGKVWKVFLIQHQKGRHWGFPKGHAEAGEDERMTATRELLEETGLGVKRFLRTEPFSEEYSFRVNGKLIRKKVRYYLVEAQGVYRLDPNEILDGRWFSFQDAALKVTFSETKAILAAVEKILHSL